MILEMFIGSLLMTWTANTNIVFYEPVLFLTLMIE